MPRTTPVDSYVMHRLRFIAGNKRYAPSIQLRAINRISAIEARKAAGLHWAYTVKISDDDRDGEYLLRPTSEKPPSPPAQPDDVLQEMLKTAEQAKRGRDGDKLSNS